MKGSGSKVGFRMHLALRSTAHSHPHPALKQPPKGCQAARHGRPVLCEQPPPPQESFAFLGNHVLCCAVLCSESP
jgi:hypothetical protein